MPSYWADRDQNYVQTNTFKLFSAMSLTPRAGLSVYLRKLWRWKENTAYRTSTSTEQYYVPV